MLIKNRIALILALLILLCGCEKMTVNHKFNKEELTQDHPIPSEIGRYQIVFGRFARADAYLLDTKTGRVWSFAIDPSREGDPGFWKEEAVEDNPYSLSFKELLNTHPPKKKKSAEPPAKKAA